MGYYIFIIALVAALGGFVYGVDSGTIATTIGHDSFQLYMLGPAKTNAPLLGAIVSLYNSGQAVGTVVSGYSADKLSRRWTICGAALTSVLGDFLQTIANGPAMMITGRFLSGCGCGILLSVVPVYMAEVSPPKQRGFIVGLQGMMISIGYMLANWIGYFAGWASGDIQWRVPLAVQVTGPLILFLGCFFIPYSPLWLIEQQRYDEAKTVLLALHTPHNENLLKEFTQIRNQIELERLTRHANWFQAARELFSRKYIRRTATACFILMMVQLSGSNVIQNYQNIFYGMVGYKESEALLISGAYGTMGVLGQAVYLVFVADRWPRRRTLWVGSLFLCTTVSTCLALSSLYRDGDANLLSRLAVAFIFMFSCGYAIFFNAMVWVVPSELFPFFLRSKGLGFAVFCRALCGIVLAQITPVALQEVSWRYYSLFIATNFSAAIVYFFFLPETKGRSLQEIAEIFGDELATNNSEGDSLDCLEKTSLHLEHVDIEKGIGSPSGSLMSKGMDSMLGTANLNDLRVEEQYQFRREQVNGRIKRKHTNCIGERRIASGAVGKTLPSCVMEKGSNYRTRDGRLSSHKRGGRSTYDTVNRWPSSRVMERKSESRTSARRTLNPTINEKSTYHTTDWGRSNHKLAKKITNFMTEEKSTGRTVRNFPVNRRSSRSRTAMAPTESPATLDYPVLSYPTLGFARGMDGQTFFFEWL